MDSPRKKAYGNDDSAEGLDPADRPVDGDASEESREIDGLGSSGPSDSAQGSRRMSGGFADRLRDVLGDGAGGDLLLERSDRENGVLQRIRALDLQVLGACRADERLKPLLKLSISSGFAEDRLTAQLSQHFEASEVGMLARCLCTPLVSIRVGKVHKQGSLLCPTASRGHLNLSLLPSSVMHLSFFGDDGYTERLAVVSKDSETSAVIIEKISADSTGRSFLLKLPGVRVSYFWCSEKLKFHGMELLSKMKDVLRRKPSLSFLTGICESRLESFATHLGAYLLGSKNSANANSTASSSSLLATPSSPHVSSSDSQSSPTVSKISGSDSQPSSTVSKTSRFRFTTAHTEKLHALYQGSLSPRSNTFKDGQPRSLLSTRSGVREKLRQQVVCHSGLLPVNSSHASSASTSCSTHASSAMHFEDDKILGGSGCFNYLPSCLPELPCLLSPPSTSKPSQVTVPTLFSPQYCWCPPSTSSLQHTVHTVTPLHLPSTLTESLPLPSLSSLLSAAKHSASLVPFKSPIDLAELPTLDLPAFFPEPAVHFPIPLSPLVTMPSSQQIPTFIPFMSDPIVHIPVIDVFSSGQSYLVSAGPAISSSIPPLLSNFANPLMTEAESMLEKSARETLRMLMASTPTPTNLQLKVFPAVLTGVDENFCVHGSKHGVLAGSQGFYSGPQDVDAASIVVASMGLTSSKESTFGVCDGKRGELMRESGGDDVEDGLSLD